MKPVAAPARGRVALVGLPPDYSYPGDTRAWWADTTSQAANLGAAFITRSLLRQLDADFVPLDTPVEEVEERYDHVVLALATHLHRRRDVTPVLDLVREVDLPVHAFSLGVEDYIGEHDIDGYRLDATVLELLSIVADRSGVLGCRGQWSADVLAQNGFDDVVPYGCPSIFWQGSPQIEVSPPSGEGPVVCAFHRSLVEAPALLDPPARLVGQDFQDHALMTRDLDTDSLLLEKNERFLDGREHAERLRWSARVRGDWPGRFDRWFDSISGAGFVYGPRLHGCIAALASGVPALLLTRDLRTREMVHSLGLPHLPLVEAAERSVGELMSAVDLDTLRSRYAMAYVRYIDLLDTLNLPHRLTAVDETPARVDVSA